MSTPAQPDLPQLDLGTMRKRLVDMRAEITARMKARNADIVRLRKLNAGDRSELENVERMLRGPRRRQKKQPTPLATEQG